MLNWPQVYLGVGLTALATLVLELALTRIFSVVFYHYFAFLAISIALFGLGAGGLFSYAIAGRSARFFNKLGTLAAFNSICVVASLAFVLTRRGEPEGGTLALVYLMSALPFFLSGIIIATVIAETVERVDKVYFFDLIGAAAGGLMIVPLLDYVGGPSTVIATAVLYAASSAIWFTLAGSLKGRAVAVIVALALVLLMVINTRNAVIDVTYAKGEQLQKELFVKWNSFSRIAMVPNEESGRMSINIDASATTEIPNFDFGRLSEAELHELLYEGPGVPYLLRPGAKTLIIGPGGGWDVARALASGSRDITGIEINPIIANSIMRERFPAMSKGLYFRPELRIVVGDGRSFVRKSHEEFQVLQATLVDSRSSAITGSYALSENNLYTTEAFYDYLNHLSSDGLMAFTRWGFDPPHESLRVVSLAMEALQRLGRRESWRHVIVMREPAESHDKTGFRDTVIVSRSPLEEADIIRSREIIEQGGMLAAYLPGIVNGNPYAELLRSPNPALYQSQYPLNISPVSDNRPFFSYAARPSDILDFLRNGSDNGNTRQVNRAVPLLFRLLGVSLLATAIVLVLPPLFLGSRLPRDRGVAWFLWYFVFTGAGLHTCAGRPDPEVCSLSGAPHIRAHGNNLLDAGLQRHWKLLQPACNLILGTRPYGCADCSGLVDCIAGGADITLSGFRRRLATGGKSYTHSRSDCAGRFRYGDTISSRPDKTRQAAQPVTALGLVSEPLPLV